MHLVGFIIRIYHDARSPERQKQSPGTHHGGSGSMPDLVHAGFVMEKMALWQLFVSEYFGVPPVIIIPPMLHNHLFFTADMWSQQLTVSLNDTH